MAVSLKAVTKSMGLESPVFDAPPVVETAIGFRFAPIEGFNALHLGQLAESYKGQYPNFQLKPPVFPVLDLNFNTESPNFDIPARCWCISSDDTQLVQLQRDLFTRNWRATESHPDYQHYKTIRPSFVRDWDTLCRFLEERGFKRPVVWQCEVSYINHLVRGKEWNSFDDLAKLFPIWRGLQSDGLFRTMESASFTVSYKLGDENSRIQFLLQPGVRQDGREVVQLTVTALGKPNEQENQALYDWLDFGHVAVINGFVQFTSSEAHQIWRRK
jgi:uncharacterized protein (TIGR04255 family)